MALAILGVLFSHAANDYGWFPFNRLTVLGYGGVDLFFFLSGFGLFYSCSKDDSFLAFYRKRFLRVYPAFFVVLLLWLWKNNRWEWRYDLMMASTLGYWFPTSWGWHYLAWFVSAIFLLYLIFPFYYRWFRVHPWCATAVMCLSGVALSGVYTYSFSVVYPGSYNGYILFFARIPVFFLGVAFGSLSKTYGKSALPHQRLCITLCAVFFIVGFVGINLLFDHCKYLWLRLTGLLFFPFMLIVPGFCLCGGWLFSHLPGWVSRALAPVGSTTLEAYMLMSIFFSWKGRFIAFCGGNATAGCLLLVATTLVAAYALHHLLSPIVRLATRR